MDLLPAPTPRTKSRCYRPQSLNLVFLSLVFCTFICGVVFDYIPFPGEPGYTNVAEGGIQEETNKSIWSAPLKSPPVDTEQSKQTQPPFFYANLQRNSTISREPEAATEPLPTTPIPTTKRAKREDDSDPIRKAAEAVLEHDLGLEQAHVNGFRAAGIDEITMERLQRQVREELRRRKRRSIQRHVGGLATSAGIAALQHVFQKFDLVPKAYKALSRNPGYSSGVPAGHPRQLPYDFSGYANPRPELAFGELGGRRLPVAGLF